MEEDKKKQSEEGLQEDTSAETELNAGDELAVADGESRLTETCGSCLPPAWWRGGSSVPNSA